MTQLVEPGIYRHDGKIFKVQLTRDKQRSYAKELVDLRPTEGDRLNVEDVRVRFKWEYASGAIFRLSPEDRMTEEDAKEFGLRTGICACCGRRLKVAQSVEQGIGPVCIKWFRW